MDHTHILSEAIVEVIRTMRKILRFFKLASEVQMNFTKTSLIRVNVFGDFPGMI